MFMRTLPPNCGRPKHSPAGQWIDQLQYHSAVEGEELLIQEMVRMDVEIMPSERRQTKHILCDFICIILKTKTDLQ